MTASDSYPGGTICQMLWCCIWRKSHVLDKTVTSTPSPSTNAVEGLSSLQQCQLLPPLGDLLTSGINIFNSIYCKDLQLSRANPHLLSLSQDEWTALVILCHCFLPSILSFFPSPPFNITVSKEIQRENYIDCLILLTIWQLGKPLPLCSPQYLSWALAPTVQCFLCSAEEMIQPLWAQCSLLPTQSLGAASMRIC